MCNMMLLQLFLFNLLFIPIIFGTNTTSKTENNSATTLPPKNAHKDELLTNITKQIVVSEGGPIVQTVQNTPSLLLPNEKSSPVVSPKELGKDVHQTYVPKVVPRKGVVYPVETATDAQTTANISSSEHKDLNDVTGKNMSLHKKTKIAPIVSNSDLRDHDKTDNTSAVQHQIVNNSKLPKKPLILSYDALANFNQGTKSDLKVPVMESSAKSLIADQMPSPSNDSGPTIKANPMSAGSHPGMIMPIVITILVVPMFAVLGYMALRRGKEAWKNRHYKRMDFLLDGMYND